MLSVPTNYIIYYIWCSLRVNLRSRTACNIIYRKPFNILHVHIAWIGFSILFLIICIFSTRAENCINLVNLITTKKLFVLNETETVMFYSTDFEFVTTEYDGVTCSNDNCSMTNEIFYKNNRLKSFSDTDLAINDVDLSTVIYNSMTFDTLQLLINVISVFRNRFVARSVIEKNNFLIYSIVLGIEIDLPKSQ